MKYRFEKRILSLVLCLSMLFTLIITHANFAFSAEDEEYIPTINTENFENNVGKQAIFDWWDNFFIVDDPTREDIADIYMYTDVNSTYDDGENYWYLYEEKFYYDGTSTGQPFIDAYDVKMIITDYYYDNINGYHWYKVTGADLPEPLVEKPWILYALDADSEYGFDPTLCIYEIDETIRFVTTELKDYAIDGDGNYVLDENGNYIEEGIPLLNFYVFAGPMEIANAEISITSRNEDYPVSELSCMENTYGTIFSKAFDFTIDKAIGEEVDLWTPEDGMISIRYQSTMLPADTYKQDCYCGSAFMYVDDKLFCATSTERSIEISDLTYTNSGSSVLVIELLDETFFRERQPAYFVNDSVTLYDNNMQAAEFLAAQLPVTFTAECSFEDENGEEYYWLENKGFIGSPYFIAKKDDVMLGELPEEYGDGRVSITDKMGNSVSEIVLPQYEKPEFSAISSLSKTTADVKYQWQICYDVDNYLWVDIYGENNATIKISYGMVKTLLDENGQCAIRCESKTSTMAAYSKPIVITLEMYEPKEPDVVVSESFVTSNGETVTVSVAGDIPEDASVALEETDSSGVEVNEGETVVASLDISIKNADGSEWQPESGETVKVELPATAIGLNEGDRFVVYHLHNGEVKVLGTYTVTDGTVAFDVDGFSKFVFALAEQSIATDDLQHQVTHKATINSMYNDLWLVKDPTVITGYQNIYTTAYEGVDYVDGIVFVIADVYISEIYPYGVFYKVEALDSNNLFSAVLLDYPWVFQRYLDESDDYGTLVIQEEVAPPTEPDEPVEPEEPAEPYVDIYNENGEIVDFIEMLASEKPSITAKTSLTGSVKYQWQVCYDIDNYLWMDIYGQTSETLTLSYALLAGVMNDEGMSGVRCITSNAAETIEGYPLVVMMLEPYTDDSTYSLYGIIGQYVYDAFKAQEAYGKDVSGASADSPEQVSGVTSRAGEKVIVTLIAKQENGTVVVHQPYELEMGGDVSQTNVEIPYIKGYDLYDANGNVLTPQEVDGKKVYLYNVIYNDVTESFEVVLNYKPGKTTYTVEYYLQNVLDNGYTKHDKTVTIEGVTGDMPDVTNEAFKKAFEGFYQLKFATDPISSDGSTVVEIYYDRLYFKMLFDLDGGYGVQPVYARYETPVSVVNPTKAGYSFMGWNALNGPYNKSDDENTVDIDTFTDIKIPAMHTNYKALWYATEDAHVTVVIWGEKANNTGSLDDHNSYDYISKTEDGTDLTKLHFNAKPSTTVIYNPNGGYICGHNEEHTHGQDNCEITCGEEAHTHTSIGGACYLLSCGKQEHTVHTVECYNCGITTNHTHSKNCYSDVGDEVNGIIAGFLGNGAEGEVKKGRLDTYIYISNTWYYYTGDTASGKIAPTTCIGTHTHSDACGYKCSGIHTHDSGCYTLTCTKKLHAHNANCYSGCTKEEHTHTADCQLSIPMNSTLWEFDHSGEVTVAADGSSTLNVYYRRTSFTLTFVYNNNTVATIKEKWGTNIKARFDEIETQTKAKLSNRQALAGWKDSTTSKYTNYVGIMPKMNKTFTANIENSNEDTNTMTYYFANLNGVYEEKFKIVFTGDGYTVTEDEYYEIEGFQINKSKSTSPNKSCKGAKFYYDRISTNIVFNNYGTVEDKKTLLYETPLASYESFELDQSKSPAVYQAGSVTFKGWYLAPQTPNDFDFDKDKDGKEDVTPFDFANSTMPANDIILYAWWEPVEHDVTFYLSYEEMLNNNIYTVDDKAYDYDVPHGSKIQNPYYPPNDPENGRYEFVGWFYVNENGIETMWDFDNSTVTSDVKLYAKWTSKTLVPYTINFVYRDKDGNETVIGEPITGSALAGNNKRFFAKVGSELKEGYQSKYFPKVPDHSLTFDIDDETKNVYTFYYEFHETVPYTVHYITKENPGNALGTITYNGETYYKVYATKEVTNNDKAIVTENAEMISGYVFDEYQKRLNIDVVDATKNVIYFIYKKDIVNGQYIVHYMTQNANGTGFDEHSTFTGKMEGGSTYTVPNPPKTIQNFTWAEGHEKEKLSGTVEVGKILELWVYYTRNEFPYKVQYLDRATGQPIIADKTGSAKWESQVTENYVDIKGYELANNTSYTIDISDDASKNVITFYYVKDVTIRYQVVGPIGSGTVTPDSEVVKAITGNAQGSTAKPSSNAYKFVGWYSDKDCQNPVPAEWVDASGKITPQKLGELWINGTTYYAKFEYNLTSLTIKKVGWETIDPNQTFIFNIKGNGVGNNVNLDVTVHGNGSVTIDGLTVGATYTVTEKTDWSWRYEFDSVSVDKVTIVTQKDSSVSITIGLNGTITFTNERKVNQWLDGDSWCNNMFKPVNQTK